MHHTERMVHSDTTSEHDVADELHGLISISHPFSCTANSRNKAFACKWKEQVKHTTGLFTLVGLVWLASTLLPPR
eukprot:1036539-Amphidinium_carterae.1